MTSTKASIDAANHDKMDLHLMKLALEQAKISESIGEVPIGAIIVDGKGRIIAKSTNLREKLKSTLGHAELVAVHRACKKLDSWRLIDCTLYVTLEPCFMCAGALVQARIKRVVYGALDPKGGALHSLHTLGNDNRLNHKFEVTGGICADESTEMLKSFFRKKRKAQA